MRSTSSIRTLVAAALVATSVPGVVFAQEQRSTNGTVSGMVTDRGTRQPVDGARVSINGTPYGATSKPDGTYLISAPPGTYTLTVTKTGYPPTEVPNVTVEFGQRRTQAIELARSGAGANPSSMTATFPAMVEQGIASTRVAYPVRTFSLQSLSPAAAANLLAPYMPQQAGVFEAGASINAITVRAPKEVLTTVDSLLHVYDHALTTITLHFKLIVATDSAAHDPTIPEIDATLRQMFRFNGYRQIAEGTTTISPNSGPGFTSRSNFSMNLMSGGTDYWLSGDAGATSGTAPNLSQQLTVTLYSAPSASSAVQGMGGRGPGPGSRSILSTGLTVPIGQTVVIGGATGNDGGRTLILTVRPELVAAPAKR